MKINNKIVFSSKVRKFVRDDKELILFPDIPCWFIGPSDTYDKIMALEGKPTSIVDKSNDKLLDFLVESEIVCFKENPIPSTDASKEIYPINVFWLSVESRCNLNCKHCFLGEKNNGNHTADNMTPEEISHFVDDLLKVSYDGPIKLTIAGGEPLLRKDIVEILKAVKKDRIVPNLVTNGLLLNDEIIEYLAKNKIETTISIDGPEKESHEYLCGENTFERVVENTKKCCERGVPIILSLTIHKANQHLVFDYLKFAENLGASKIIFGFLNNIGNAKENQLGLPDECEIIINLLKEAAKNEKVLSKLMYTAISKFVETVFFPIRTDCCGSGINNCSLQANGDVYPCPSFQDDSFCAGNVRERSFDDIWNDNNTFPLHRKVNVNEMNSVCSTCDVRLFCGGGCRAQAYYSSNEDINGRNPQCKELKKLYIEIMWMLEQFPQLTKLHSAQGLTYLENN